MTVVTGAGYYTMSKEEMSIDPDRPAPVTASLKLSDKEDGGERIRSYIELHKENGC